MWPNVGVSQVCTLPRLAHLPFCLPLTQFHPPLPSSTHPPAQNQVQLQGWFSTCTPRLSVSLEAVVPTWRCLLAPLNQRHRHSRIAMSYFLHCCTSWQEMLHQVGCGVKGTCGKVATLEGHNNGQQFPEDSAFCLLIALGEW